MYKPCWIILILTRRVGFFFFFSCFFSRMFKVFMLPHPLKRKTQRINGPLCGLSLGKLMSVFAFTLFWGWTPLKGFRARPFTLSRRRKARLELPRRSAVRDVCAIQSAGTAPKRDNFKLSCGLPQCPRDQLSGQMSGVTENKFIFPQWEDKKGEKKRTSLPIRKKKKYLHISEFGWSRLENVASSLWLLWRRNNIYCFE